MLGYDRNWGNMWEYVWYRREGLWCDVVVWWVRWWRLYYGVVYLVLFVGFLFVCGGILRGICIEGCGGWWWGLWYVGCCGGRVMRRMWVCDIIGMLLVECGLECRRMILWVMCLGFVCVLRMDMCRVWLYVWGVWVWVGWFYFYVGGLC